MPDIVKPGLYFDMPASDYDRDPCPSPSLRASAGKLMIEKSPRHVWTGHPRLNPDWEADDPTKYDVGNVAHTLMLGRGKQILRLDEKFDSWRTNEAKAAREAAGKDGKLAVLAKDYDAAMQLVAVARAELKRPEWGCDGAFVEGQGDGEVVIACEEDGVWLRAMIDWRMKDGLTYYDLKTTAKSAAPHNLSNVMKDAGWQFQAAFQDRILDVIDPETAGRRTYRFVVCEDDDPFALSVAELSSGVLDIGRKQVQVAVEHYKECLARGVKTEHWPAYPRRIVVPEFPAYAEAAWLDREIVEFAEVIQRMGKRPQKPNRPLPPGGLMAG